MSDFRLTLERLGNAGSDALSGLVSSENRARAAASRLRTRAQELLREADGLDADAEHARLSAKALQGALDRAVATYHAERIS